MISILLGVAASLLPLLPSVSDRHGWGLRVHALSNPGPFLAGEYIERRRFKITLINFSDRVQFHDPLAVAYESKALDVVVLGPDGKEIDVRGGDDVRGNRNPFTVQTKLPPGGVSSLEFNFISFGYAQVYFPGRYRIEGKLSLVTDGKFDGRVVSAPTTEFEVLPLKAETVVASYTVPLEGRELKLPANERERPVIQQVNVGGRTLLVYRRYHSPKHVEQVAPRVPGFRDLVEIYCTFRLAELPGKCEMKVEGAYGDARPLTITYKTSPTAEPTKLVINSISGSPWTQEEERLLQERLKREKEKPVAPAPKP